MIHWEYKSYMFDRGEKLVDVLAKMNKFGAEGWEAFHFPATDGHNGFRVLFKRQTQPTKESTK